MKSFCLILFLSCCLFASGSAALPPLAQSIREYRELIASDELMELLDSCEMIETIISSGSGYIVITSHSMICVDVVYEASPSGWAGPSRFSLIFHDALPLRN